MTQPVAVVPPPPTAIFVPEEASLWYRPNAEAQEVLRAIRAAGKLVQIRRFGEPNQLDYCPDRILVWITNDGKLHHITTEGMHTRTVYDYTSRVTPM